MSSKGPRHRRSSRSSSGGPEASARPGPRSGGAEDARGADGPRDAASPEAPPLDEHGVSLYVHLPWCVRKCRYCDFNSWAWRGQALAPTVDALLTEARARAEGLRPQTVFVGGGTPSLLPADELARLLEGLQAITGFRDSALEATMEANPESLDADTARAAREGGIDRLSIGVQSLRAEVLEAYDRVHSADDALRAFATAREAGFARVNLDLIYAFPGQTAEEWETDLRRVLALGPEHVSCYELSYEPGTALTRLRDAGRWEPSDVDRCLQLFRLTESVCAEHGLHAYEVSAYARAGEPCRHNLAYWRSLDHVGIGAGAVTWRGGERRKALSDPAAWAADPLAVEELERPDPATRLFDHLMMGLRLRTEGVLLDRAARQSGLDPRAHYGERLERLVGDGLLERVATAEGERLRATARGIELLDGVLHDLAPAPAL